MANYKVQGGPNYDTGNITMQAGQGQEPTSPEELLVRSCCADHITIYFNVPAAMVGIVLDGVVLLVWNAQRSFHATLYLFKAIASINILLRFFYLMTEVAMREVEIALRLKAQSGGIKVVWVYLMQAATYGCLDASLYVILLMAAVRFVRAYLDRVMQERLIVARCLKPTVGVVLTLCFTHQYIISAVKAGNCGQIVDGVHTAFLVWVGVIMTAVVQQLGLMVAVVLKSRSKVCSWFIGY